VCRETGKEYVVKVRHDEDVASHIGPESCVHTREGAREALTWECAGQPLSREGILFRCADEVT
jgi:hypothetical protein